MEKIGVIPREGSDLLFGQNLTKIGFLVKIRSIYLINHIVLMRKEPIRGLLGDSGCKKQSQTGVSRLSKAPNRQ